MDNNLPEPVFSRENYTDEQLGAKLLELYDSGELSTLAAISVGSSEYESGKFYSDDFKEYIESEFLKINVG